jgi:hypothetical protein
VAGVAEGNHRSFAGAFDELPAVVGLLGVVVFAQRVALVEAGVSGVAVGDAMVDLDPGAGAAFDVQPGDAHNSATRCAAFGPRPR